MTDGTSLAYGNPDPGAANDMSRRSVLLGTASLIGGLAVPAGVSAASAPGGPIELRADAGGARFDGIGVVNGGGATSVLLKDYPEPQRSQILDLLYKPRFGASVSALLVEIPGDGNSTQGSMPSHMHTRDDLDFRRGYIWWVLREAKRRNPKLTLDATAWSAPGWLGRKGAVFDTVHSEDPTFFSQDTVDYYLTWMRGLRQVYGLELDAIGCRNEKGVSYGFAKAFRRAMNERGFASVKLHGFDNWPAWKLDFVADMAKDRELRDAIDIISGHVFYAKDAVPSDVRAMAQAMGKPIWNTEDHVYYEGFKAAIEVVRCFNHNHIRSGVTKIVNWYDIAGVYPTEPYSVTPACVLAHSPWSGHYEVREALWGYAHYGQFSEIGWTYLNGGSGMLDRGGSFVTLASPSRDYSVIVETQGAPVPQVVRFRATGLSGRPLCVWRSDASAQFIRQADLQPGRDGVFSLTVAPDSIYSLSTTRGQMKGSFTDIPAMAPFPLPYRERFDDYGIPATRGYLPRFTADIAGAFELAERPDRKGSCLRQVVPVPTISWAPDWHPYTILGDAAWADYEIAVDLWLNPGDRAAVMGRINHVGTGYGFVPKGYYFELAHDGTCRLVLTRGKKDPKKLIGDAEQQALIRAGKWEGEGGERELARTLLSGIGPGRWHRLALRFEGSRIIGTVDGRPALMATDSLYGQGMAGLLAGAERDRLSTPWYDDIAITPIGANVGLASRTPPLPLPLYPRRS